MVFDFIFLKIIFKLFYSLVSNVYDSVLYITIHNDKMSICTPSTQLIYKDLSFYVHLNSSVCLSKLFVIWQLRHITNLISSYFFQTFYFRHTSQSIQQTYFQENNSSFLYKRNKKNEEINISFAQ